MIQEPERPWELMQLGNCGSPLETDAGWLVITHGVGPMRRYTLGALLLDIDDPSRVIGHLREPLLSPGDDERDGYVPNVVYSCGSLIHGDHLVLPYGYADVGARVATIRVDELLSRLTRPVEVSWPAAPRRSPAARTACVEISASVDSAPWLRFGPVAVSPSYPPWVSGSHITTSRSLSPANHPIARSTPRRHSSSPVTAWARWHASASAAISIGC